MKNLIRGLLVSALAIGSVAVASPFAHADVPNIPACGDFVDPSTGDYTGNVYVGPTPLTLDPSDSTQLSLMNTLPTESDGALVAHVYLAAPACADFTYRVTLEYPDGHYAATDVTGQSADHFDITAPVTRHSGYCVSAQISSIDGAGVTQDLGPDNGFDTVCNNGTGPFGTWK